MAKGEKKEVTHSLILPKTVEGNQRSNNNDGQVVDVEKLGPHTCKKKIGVTEKKINSGGQML